MHNLLHMSVFSTILALNFSFANPTDALATSSDNASQEFLDQNQYTPNGILRYERIFGDGFISTGGIETTEKAVAQLNLQPGQKVLDVGCGIGGGDVYMADTYGVEVHGIDLSTNMVAIAQQRYSNHPLVTFSVEDVLKADYPAESFDVVYSRDTFIHLHDKVELFTRLLHWLKPGGTLFITDYCRGSGNSEEFEEYVAQRGYHLVTPQEYGQLIEKAGFADVQAIDQSAYFTDILTRELVRAEADREGFIEEFSEKDYLDIVEGWRAKLVRVAKEEQKWGWFRAKKAK